MPSQMPSQAKALAARPGRIYRGVSEAVRRSERQQRLIDTAIEAFGTRGIRHVSVRDICSAAGFTPRYFYESFADLDGLLAATVDLLLERLADDLRQAFHAGPMKDPRRVLRRMVRAYLEFLRKDARATRILMVEIYGMGLDMDRLSNRFIRSLGAEFLPLMAALGQAGLPRKASAGLVLTGSLGAMVFIGTRWISTGYGAPIETVVESCMSLIALPGVEAG